MSTRRLSGVKLEGDPSGVEQLQIDMPQGEGGLRVQRYCVGASPAPRASLTEALL